MSDGQSEQGVSFLENDKFMIDTQEPDLTFDFTRLELKRGYENIVYGPYAGLDGKKVYKETNWKDNVKDLEDVEAKVFLDSEDFYNWSKLADNVYEKLFGKYYLKEIISRVTDKEGRSKNIRIQDYIDGRTLGEIGEQRKIQETYLLTNKEGRSVKDQHDDILIDAVQFFLKIGIPADISDSNIMLENDTNNLIFFDAGPMVQIYYLINSDKVVSKEFEERLKKYFDLMGNMTSDRLSRCQDQLQERTGLSLEKYKKLLEIAKKDPISFIKGRKPY
jgi:hypothetical protein